MNNEKESSFTPGIFVICAEISYSDDPAGGSFLACHPFKADIEAELRSQVETFKKDYQAEQCKIIKMVMTRIPEGLYK